MEPSEIARAIIGPCGGIPSPPAGSISHLSIVGDISPVSESSSSTDSPASGIVVKEDSIEAHSVGEGSSCVASPHRRAEGWVADEEQCCVCWAEGTDTEGGGQNPIIRCKGCGINVHLACYGLEEEPEGGWSCQSCCRQETTPLKCRLCPHVGGAMKQAKCGSWVHVDCALWVCLPFLLCLERSCSCMHSVVTPCPVYSRAFHGILKPASLSGSASTCTRTSQPLQERFK